MCGIWNGSYTASDVRLCDYELCLDSIVALNLTILEPTTSLTTLVEWDSYNWNGSTYMTSGIYTWSTINAVGCDLQDFGSYNFKFNYITNYTYECDSYTWNGQTYGDRSVHMVNCERSGL